MRLVETPEIKTIEAPQEQEHSEELQRLIKVAEWFARKRDIEIVREMYGLAPKIHKPK